MAAESGESSPSSGTSRFVVAGALALLPATPTALVLGGGDE